MFGQVSWVAPSYRIVGIGLRPISLAIVTRADCQSALTTEIAPQLAAWNAQLVSVQKQIGRATPIPTILYEGATQLTCPNTSVPYYAAMVGCQTSPGMQSVFAQYLNMLSAGGIEGLILTNAIYPANQSGQWGLQQYTGEPSASTPKLSAVAAFLNPAPPPPPG